MILILTSSNDESTHEVMAWLYHLSPNTEIVRINECDKVSNVTISNHNIILKFKRQFCDDVEVDFSKITHYWYRKQNLDIYKLFIKSFDFSYLKQYQKEELDIIIEYIHFSLLKVKHIGSMLTSSMNKLKVNSIASALGLEVPHSLVSSDLSRVHEFSKVCKEQMVTKAISESIFLRFENEVFIGYTESVKMKDFNTNQSTIFPSLFQNKVEKVYELRIFYLKGTFDAMAIFSQRDAQTETDFRKYNYETPNRNVPFNLPQAIKDKLKQLFDRLDLNTGSVDMMVDKQGRYIFLEINPVGQFGMVSIPNNSYIEKKIAKELLS